MNDPTLKPLHGVAIYNPDLLDRRELKELFVARKPLLNRLLSDLQKEAHDGPLMHHLIVGARGMGKTTLLRMLGFAIKDDAELSRNWLPLPFPEEQYNIGRLSHLWMNCLDALGDVLETRGRADEARALDREVASLHGKDEKQEARQALAMLSRKAEAMKKRLILLIDNLDIVFNHLKKDHWAIREALSIDPNLLLVGASSQAIESAYTYDEAFYDFFQIHELKSLSREEVEAVLLRLAEIGNTPHVTTLVENDPARPRALQVLTGGNPRTITLLYNILAQGDKGDVRTDLERLLDMSTPLYKARFDGLPIQAQRIVDALAIAWDPLRAGDLSEKLQLPVNAISAQLNRLVHQGVVEKVKFHPGKKAGFQIAERFFNIWYLMRASRRLRRKLIWLVEFLKIVFSQGDLKRRALRHLKTPGEMRSKKRIHHAEFSLALAQTIEDRPLRAALESRGLRIIVSDSMLRKEPGASLDLVSDDKKLKTVAERMEALAGIKERIFQAKVKFKDWSAEQFWELLGGAPLTPLQDKAMAANNLERISDEGVQEIIIVLKRQSQKILNSIRHDRIAKTLFEAIRKGYMDGIFDVEGSESASLILNEPELKSVVLAIYVEKHPADSIRMLNKIEEAIQNCQLPGPLYVFGGFLADHMVRFIDAESVLKKAIEFDGGYADPWNSLGNIYRDNLNRFEDAEEAFKKAIELDTGFVQPWNGLGILYADELGRYEEAEKIIKKAIEIDSNCAQPWYNLGRLFHHNLKQYDEAEAAYKKALEVDDNYSLAWFGLGKLYSEKTQRHKDAEEAYKMAIEVDENSIHPWNGLGDLYSQYPELFEGAKKAYKKATEIDNTDFYAWNSLGDLYSENPAFFKDAETAYKKALEIDVCFVDAWNGLGKLYSEQTELYKEAENAYKKAIEIDPGFAYTWYLSGVLYGYLLERHGEAEAALKQAVEIEPENYFYHSGFAAFLYGNNRDVALAEDHARKALELNSEYLIPMHTLAMILLAKENWTEAEKSMRKFFQKSSSVIIEETW